MKYIKILTACFLLACLGFYVVSSKELDRLLGQKLFQDESEANNQSQSEELNFDLDSKYAILVEQDSGKVLYTKQAKKQIHPASLTKIMTVYLALQSIIDENKMVQVPANIFPKLEAENASVAGFQPNENVRIKDLLYGALLPSGADACITLAQTIDGSEDLFVKHMNETAKQLGMHDTHFTNCTGLDDDQHYSSVYDLQLLLREALKNDIFAEIFHTKSYVVEGDHVNPTGFTMYGTMWQTMDIHNLYSDFLLGGKTGYTPDAGLCLASQGSVNGTQYLLITAGANGDAETKPYHILDAMKVYEKLKEKS